MLRSKRLVRSATWILASPAATPVIRPGGADLEPAVIAAISVAVIGFAVGARRIQIFRT